MLKERKIAVVMELQWPYRRHYEVFSGIQEYAGTHANWKFDLGNYPELAIAEGVRFDGIIGRIGRDCHAAARKAGIPVVNVWIDSPVAARIPGVHPDSRAAGRMTAEHLIARGLKHLTHFGYKGTIYSKRHFEGMREVASEHGYPCTGHTVSRHYDTSRDQWVRFVGQVKRIQAGWQPPVGVGCVGDALSRAVASVCLMAGWSIPEQLVMVGTGNDLLICTSFEPTLSSLDLGYHQCGYEAARVLHGLMNGGDPPSEVLHVPPKALVVRHTSDFYAVSDPKVARALRFMAEHAGGALSVSEIAGAVGLGRQSLERRFRRHVGRTINDELIRLRVSKLKRLLVQSGQPITILSAQAGFGTTVSMHTMFKRHTGMTPEAYRKKHRPRPERDEPGT
jgi:LacI family transcriptional regulator